MQRLERVPFKWNRVRSSRTECALRAVARQFDRDGQATADAIGGADLAAQRLDIATDDPQSETGMSGGSALLAVLGTRRKIALEHMRDLGRIDTGSFIVDLQLSHLAIDR